MGADDNTNGLRSELRRIKDWVLMSGNSLPNETAFIWQVRTVREMTFEIPLMRCKA